MAADNPNGNNSWFTEALSDEIRKPNQELAEIIRQVTRTVKAETGDKQMPFDTAASPAASTSTRRPAGRAGMLP